MIVKQKKILMILSVIISLLVIFSVIYLLTQDKKEEEKINNKCSELGIFDRIEEEFNSSLNIIVLVDQTDKTYDVGDTRVLTEMDEVGCLVNTYDDVVSVISLAELIKMENNKPITLGLDLGGTGKYEIPSKEDLNNYKFLSRPSVESMKGILFTDDYNCAVILIQIKSDADYDSILNRVTYATDERGTNYANMKICS